ncbi:hypothetical protein LCR01_18750 [Companilactobacillus crustorum]|uniref:Transposase n=1 Tax=Companilactobacillus crustorum TaxID=392416 RepID=A0AB34ADG9_9LACO|nr:hypothetical protein LCR01_18750 [Companilactobacillus crustorum]
MSLKDNCHFKEELRFKFLLFSYNLMTLLLSVDRSVTFDKCQVNRIIISYVAKATKGRYGL